MGIISVKTNTIGTSGLSPNFIYIETDDSNEDIGEPGYLNQIANNPYSFNNSQMALVKSLEGVSLWDVVVSQVDLQTYYSLVLNTDGCITGIQGVAGQIVVTFPTSDQVALIGLANTAVTPGAYTSANITVDAHGRIIAASNGGGSTFAWSSVSSSTTMVANTGYLVNNPGALTVLTLPATFSKYDVIEIQSTPTSQWRIAQNAGQSIYIAGGVSTTAGTGGSITSAVNGGYAKLFATANNTNLATQQLVDVNSWV